MCSHKQLFTLYSILFVVLIDFTQLMEANSDDFDLKMMIRPDVDNFPDLSMQLNESNLTHDDEARSRNKRQLLFPAQTLVQFSLCYVSPADIKRNIFVNTGFQLNFLTPNRTGQLPNSFFVVPPVINARSRDKRADDEMDNSPIFDEMMKLFDGISADQIYFLIETLLNNNGYNGTACLLHSICQMATVPLHQDGDLFHEIVQFILTPSEHSNLGSDNSEDVSGDSGGRKLIEGYATIRNPTPIREYLKAELLGKAHQDEYGSSHCDEYYKCPNSPLEKITDVIIEDD